MRTFLPNLVTLLNLAFGCLAVVFLFKGQWLTAVWCVGGSLLADFLDGAVARLLGVSSELGKQLDSLADVVSFGFVPGAILYHLLTINFAYPEVGFLITLLSALRLGKFNIDTRQTDQFIGLPTPACTIFIIGVLLVHQFDAYNLGIFIVQPAVLLIITVLFSYLLVAELPLFSLKFKHLRWQENEWRFIFLILAVLLLLWLQSLGLLLVILLYLLISLGLYFSSNKTTAS
ncbi:MAG: CDP-diacylglycerol--serine O-phosphatidyltransferase [Bacteroidota bacterium]